MSTKPASSLHRRQVMRGLLSAAAFGATSKLNLIPLRIPAWMQMDWLVNGVLGKVG